MSSDNLSLTTIVSDFITARRRERVADIRPEATTQAIIDAHPLIFGKDRDFYRVCAYQAIRDEVRRHFNRTRAKPEDALQPDRQMVLPGFVRLQQYYAIEEDGEPIERRIDLLTREQLLAKAKELRAMSVGCEEHTRELERYIKERFSDYAA